ncbi:MAG: hypothetical protein DI586_05160 [Micavibrio aeruginosavorus]|uniref:Uncharacterized protein n=1 Tax=Micavibrio aeruginosavorus TaxID=349221 RepID=A0A2W5FNP6_9BACT|nr:MAG: hypothetical protein DI586_05160 [Micavibrio aeruginosavorus]
MLVTPVNTAYQPVSKTRPVSWENVTKRVTANTVNDNPAMEITKKVPAQQFKGQFVDLLS